jgi:hypothetical protein
MLSRCRVTDDQPPMLQAVLVQTGEDRRAGMAQIISPAIFAIDGELVGHSNVYIIAAQAVLKFNLISPQTMPSVLVAS